MNTKPNVAIIADWLITFAGAEKVIAEFIEVFPDANLYAVVDFLSDADRFYFHEKHAKTTFIQDLPMAKKMYQKYLPLMPFAIEQLDVTHHDILLSSSHAVAKGIISGPDQLHISYVHSPIRYAWDLQHQYLQEAGLNKGLKGLIARYFLHNIRMWDSRTANGVDYFIANSKFIARRINKVYRRDADVIYPPVDIERFTFTDNKQEYYFTASRLVPYKRIDIIIDAFTLMPDKKLVVIGDGPEMPKLKSKATKNVELLGYQSNEILVDYMKNAKAFIFAAEEDFGITPVEAMACGTPVIAYGKGGALETVISTGNISPTGDFFYEQTPSAVVDAIRKFEKNRHIIEPSDCRNNATRFSQQRFQKELSEYVSQKWLDFCENSTR
ncbi:glycosyltransferase family 4 protein [Klebsiella pneumoniae]|nr:glycosyltransferase family 4 protein [Klebsiella pneumoniae]